MNFVDYCVLCVLFLIGNNFLVVLNRMKRLQIATIKVRSSACLHLYFGAVAVVMLSVLTCGATTLNVRDFGVVGNGTIDDSEDFQEALDAASNQSATLLIPANCAIRTTKNLFISGTCNIIGAGETSVIICDADLGSHLGRLYWMSVGITKHRNNSGMQKTFSGSISDICIKATSNAKFNRALFIFNTSHFVLSNVHFDFSEGTSTASYIFFGATSSGFNNNWAPSGQQYLQNISILNNKISAAHNTTDSEGFGVCLATNVVIADNTIYGVGDDPIGCHTITGLEISNNKCYSIDGRILVTNSTDVDILGNYCERVCSPNGTWHGGGAMIMVSLEGDNSFPAPTDIHIGNNVIFIPEQVPSYTYGIRIRGGRDVTIISNLLVMDSSGGGGGIRIEADTSYGNWVDPTGVDADHIARPRNIAVARNGCDGLYPGPVEQSGATGTLPGPFSVKGNMAGGYFWYTAGPQVESTNLVSSGNYANFKVPTSSISNASTFFAESLTGVKPNILSNGSIEYTAIRAGRVSGIVSQFAPTPSSGWINLKLVKNNVEISSATVSASGTTVLDRTDARFAFYPGDKLKLKAVGSSGLLPSGGVGLNVSIIGVETDLAANYDFDGSVAGADTSGNNNAGTVANGATEVGANGDALSLTGTGEITIPDKSCLDIADKLSISFWVNAANVSAGYAGHIIKKSTDTTDSNFDCYYFGSTSGTYQGKIAFYANAGGIWKTISPFYVLPQNQWVHVALVYAAASGGQLYINGSPVGAKVGGGLLKVNASALKIGTSIQGKIDQVRVYNRSLSNEEIAMLYAFNE